MGQRCDGEQVIDWRAAYPGEIVSEIVAACDDGRLDDAARRLYDDCPTVKPAWDQLSDNTRAVWRERACSVCYGDLA